MERSNQVCVINAFEILWSHDSHVIGFSPSCRSEEITDPIEESLEENGGFIDNFARGTAHMFR